MIFKDPKIKSSDITKKETFLRRRELLKTATAGVVVASLSSLFEGEAFAKTENVQKLPAKFNQTIFG